MTQPDEKKPSTHDARLERTDDQLHLIVGADYVSLPESLLIEVLHQAIHAGVLSKDFIAKLKARIEI